MVLAVLAALPALVITQLFFLPILCVFLAGIGLARRRFTPAAATVVVATATILLSPLGGSMFDASSYDPIETYEVPPEMQGELAEALESGEPLDSSLYEWTESGSLEVVVYRFPDYVLYVVSGIVGLAYLSVVLGAAIGIRRSRRDPPGGTP